VARLSLTTEQAWRLLTNNLPAAGQSRLTASGDNAITGILLRTRAIIGSPKWALPNRQSCSDRIRQS
jgi:hypothetical protein